MIGVRALTGDEFAAFRLARMVAAERMPYFMHGLFAAQPVAAPGLGTFAVDARWRLYVEPALLVGPDAWPVRVAGAVLLHEVGHLLRAHADRAGVLPLPVEHRLWNYAADAEINDDLLAAGAELPEGVITPELLGCEPGGVAEDYYDAIRDPARMTEFGDDDDPGCGSAAGMVPVPWESGAATVDGAAGIDAAEGDLVRRHVARAVREAEFGGRGRGSMPAGLRRWAEGVLAPPVVPWDRVLRGALRRVLADQAGCVDYSYGRVSRRRVPGVVLPSMRAPSTTVAVVVDTSGSMGPADLDAAMSEVAGVLRASGVERDGLRILACDAASAQPQRVTRISDVELVGGGGTDMRVGIAAAHGLRPAPNVVVVLTDGDTPWPDRPTRASLVCVVIGNSAATPPDWAATVHVPPRGKVHAR